MLRRPATRVLTGLALVLLLPGSAAALNPADSCWKKELKAAAKLAGSVGECEAATAFDTVDPAARLYACVDPARAAFEATWQDALAIASDAGDSCDGLAQSVDVLIGIEDALAILRFQILDRIPASAKPKVATQVGEVLLLEAGAFVKASLKAQAQAAKNGDHKKAKQKRRDKRKAFRAIWEEQMAWAQAKGVAFTLDPTGPIADIDTLVDDVRDWTQPFASKKGAREGIYVDAPVGEAPHTVRLGYFSPDADAQLEWHLGDGTVQVAGSTLEHTYPDAGHYPVRVVRVKPHPSVPMQELARLEPPIRVETEALVLEGAYRERDWRIDGHPHVEADGSSVFVVRGIGTNDYRVRRHAPDGSLELDIDVATVGLAGTDRAVSNATGEIYLTGHRSFGFGDLRALVGKLDRDGNLLWELTVRSIDLGLSPPPVSDLRVGEAVVGSGGTLYVALEGLPNAVAAVSPDGVLQWTGTNGASGAAVVGLDVAGSGDVLTLYGDGAASRHAPDGSLVWAAPFTPVTATLANGWYDDIVACSDGGALLLRGANGPTGALLTRVTPVGAVQWERDAPSDFRLISLSGGLTGLCNERFFVVGWGPEDSGIGANSYSYLLVQLGPDGSEVRRRRIFTDLDVHLDAVSLRTDAQGDVHVLANLDDDLPTGPSTGPGYSVLEYGVEATAEVPVARANVDVVGGSAPLEVRLDAGLSGNANDSVAGYEWTVWDRPYPINDQTMVARETTAEADVTLQNDWVVGLKSYRADLVVSYKDGGQYTDTVVVDVGPRPPAELPDTWQKFGGPGNALTQNLIIKGGPTAGSGSLRTFSTTHLGIDGSYVKFDWVRSGSSMTFQYKKVLFCDFFKARWVRNQVPGGTVPISLSHDSLVMNGDTYLRASSPRKNSVPGGTPVDGGPCSAL